CANGGLGAVGLDYW
nr:immunoglobulin heavy chain junction region [Macaca mulatta]MOV50026.1 immunoglobulin heavy chain junction region [Macaca mulatta]